MLGRATFTTVMSSSNMKVPVQTATSAHHFRSMAFTLSNARPRILDPGAAGSGPAQARP